MKSKRLPLNVVPIAIKEYPHPSRCLNLKTTFIKKIKQIKKTTIS